MGRHKRNSRLVINNRESNRGFFREWVGYPNWARSTVTGRLYRVYYTHGDYGRANALKLRVIRQTRNLIRMGLLRSVRGLSWELSGGMVAVFAVNAAIVRYAAWAAIPFDGSIAIMTSFTEVAAGRLETSIA